MHHWKLQHYTLEPIGGIEPEKHAYPEPSIWPELNTLGFACETQDEETLEQIRDMLGDSDITACMVGTESGEYDPIYVRYGSPSYSADLTWQLVVWGDLLTDVERQERARLHTYDEYEVYEDFSEHVLGYYLLNEGEIEQLSEIEPLEYGHGVGIGGRQATHSKSPYDYMNMAGLVREFFYRYAQWQIQRGNLGIEWLDLFVTYKPNDIIKWGLYWECFGDLPPGKYGEYSLSRSVLAWEGFKRVFNAHAERLGFSHSERSDITYAAYVLIFAGGDYPERKRYTYTLENIPARRDTNVEIDLLTAYAGFLPDDRRVWYRSYDSEWELLTDWQADSMADDRLDEWVDERIYELDDFAQQYFDRNAYKKDVLRSDGRGYFIASYDGWERDMRVTASDFIKWLLDTLRDKAGFLPDAASYRFQCGTVLNVDTRSVVWFDGCIDDYAYIYQTN